MKRLGSSDAREQWAEVLLGFAVIAAAGAFLAYSLSAGGAARTRDGYEVTAKFGDVGALAPGSNVSVAGVKVGAVTDITLDPANYLAVVHLRIDDKVKLPSDSTAKITSDSLLGGAHVVISPGGAADNLKPGSQIENAQGAVDMFGLIGQFLRPQSGTGSSAPAGAATSGAATSGATAGGASAEDAFK
jgi:phospholipid/cholesterol/gamma-HCH transport system substrate-binding protein